MPPIQNTMKVLYDDENKVVGVEHDGVITPAAGLLRDQAGNVVGYYDADGDLTTLDGQNPVSTKTIKSDAGHATSKPTKMPTGSPEVIGNVYHNETPLPAQPAWDWDGSPRAEAAPTLMANGKRPPNYSGACGAPPTTWGPMGEAPLPATPIMNFDDRRPVANSNACSCKCGAKQRPAVANAGTGEETPLPAPCWD